jgi:hypothetical protein
MEVASLFEEVRQHKKELYEEFGKLLELPNFFDLVQLGVSQYRPQDIKTYYDLKMSPFPIPVIFDMITPLPREDCPRFGFGLARKKAVFFKTDQSSGENIHPELISIEQTVELNRNHVFAGSFVRILQMGLIGLDNLRDDSRVTNPEAQKTIMKIRQASQIYRG